MSLVSLELLLLDLREFMDVALIFIESYEQSQRDLRAPFSTNSIEITQLRQFAIEYQHTIYEIKSLLQDSNLITEFNRGIEFSNQFNSKRVRFFKNLFERLEKLNERINGELSLSNDLVKIYFTNILNLIKKTNEFIGYLEGYRWNRDIAIKIIDKLAALLNDFSCIFEKFISSIKSSLINNNNRKNAQKSPKYKKGSISTINKVSTDNSSLESNNSSTGFSVLKKLSRYFFKKTSNPKKMRTISRICGYILLGVFIIVIIIFLFILLPIMRLVPSVESTTQNFFFTKAEPKTFSSYFDYITIKIIELPAGIIKETPITLQINPNQEFWFYVYFYITDIYLIFFCLVIFLLFDWLINKR